MPRYWDPVDVLQLCNDGECVGYAPSKRRKCTVGIAQVNIRRRNVLIAELAKREPDAELLKEKLKLLAEYSLCVRWHQGQAGGVVLEWSEMIQEVYPAEEDDEESDSELDVVERTSFAHIASPSDRDEIRTLHDTIAAMQETIRTTQQQLNLLHYASPVARPTLSVPPASTAEVSPIRLSTPSTTGSSVPAAVSPVARNASPPRPTHQATTQPATPQISARSTQSAIPAAPTVSTPQAPTPQPAAPQPLTPRASAPQPSGPRAPTPTTHCSRTHVRRLPLDDECPVCYTETPLSSCSSSELVWCRSSCGRSVHSSCFDTWQDLCARQGRTLTCMVCRGPWEDECDCEGRCTVKHARRREPEGECSVCREELGGDEEGEERKLAWCKSRCGRSVHAECFEGWSAACAQRGRAATCTDCRAVWVDGCDC